MGRRYIAQVADTAFSTNLTLPYHVLGYTLAPTLEFHEQMFPTSSTCINRLYLPLLNLNAQLWDAAFLNDYFGLE